MGGSSFDLRSLLGGVAGRELDLHGAHVNPAFAGALRTIGFDVRFVRGEGAYLWDEKGRRYIDCLGGYAVFNLGRNHPGVRDALIQAMAADLPSLPGVGTFLLSGLLAKELVALAPRGLEMVYFCNSGTEGIEVALKHARAATGRERLVYCERGYHGLTMGSLSVNGNKEFREGFGGLLRASAVAFNDLAALDGELAQGDVAAFVVEPIMGKGVHMPAGDYLREAARACRKHGALLIADEVQTGLGRTGKMFACEHFGLEPDILVVAKGLSGGYVPVGAVLTSRRVHEAVFGSMEQCSRQQVTFGMHDLAMTAGLATLHYLREEKVVERAAAVGERLLNGLRSALAKHEMVKDVRGKGLMIAVEFRAPTKLALKMGWSLLHKMDQSLFCQAVLMPLLAEHRILAQVAGHKMDIIKLIPPLTLHEADADEIVAGFDAVIGACHSFPGPVWEVGSRLTAAAMKRMSSRPASESAELAGAYE